LGGDFYLTAGGQVYTTLLRWDGAAWQPFATPLTCTGSLPFVQRLLPLPDGALVVGGMFTHAGGVQVNNIAIWNGTAWAPLQLGVATLGTGQTHVNAIARAASGDLIIGGPFWYAGGVTARGVARWNGSSWSALGTGIPGQFGSGDVFAVAVAGNGDI